MEKQYKAFISYSHAADDKLAPVLQSALHRFAKPWYRLRVLRIFRDKTGLSANPKLWSSIEKALLESEYFILMASPESVKSTWVQREIETWLKIGSIDRLFIVLTGGDILWDNTKKDFDWGKTTALPKNLSNTFEEEPNYVDLRWAKIEEDISLNHPDFRNAVADISAALHNKPKDELFGEDVRQHRKIRRLTWSVVVTLLILTITAIVTAYLAVQQKNEAERQRRIALARQLTAQAELAFLKPGSRALPILLAAESMKLFPTFEADQFLRRSLALCPRPIGRIDTKANTVVFSPDGRYLAVGTYDGSPALIIDMKNNRNITPIKHANVSNLVFSGDGKYILTAGSDKTVRVWQISNGEEVNRLKYRWDLSTLDWSSDGNYLVTAHYSSHRGVGKHIVWEIKNNRKVVEVRHNGKITKVLFSADDKYIGTNDRGGDLRIWERTSSREIEELTRKGVRTFTWDPHENQHIALGKWDGMLQILNIKSGKEIKQFKYNRPVRSISLSRNGRYAASGSRDLRIWNIANDREVALLSHANPESKIAFDKSGRYMITADGINVHVWDIAAGREIVWTNGNRGVLSPDARCLVTKDSYGIQFWEPVGRPEVTLMKHNNEVYALSFSPDGKRLASVESGSIIRVWEMVSAQNIRSFRHPGVQHVCFSPDGKSLVSTGSKSTMVWNLKDGGKITGVEHPGKISHSVSANSGIYTATSTGKFTVETMDILGKRKLAALIHEGPMKANLYLGDDVVGLLAFSPDGQYLATGNITSTVKVWETHSGNEVTRIGLGLPWALGFSRDGKYLAAASKDFVGIWEVPRGRKVASWKHQPLINAITFSPDGQFLASTNSLRTSRIIQGSPAAWIWEAKTGREVAMVTHEKSVNAVTFSPCGKYLATASSDHTVRIWLWRPVDLIAEACSRLTRNLKINEWWQYFGDRPYCKTCPDLPGRKKGDRKKGGSQD